MLKLKSNNYTFKEFLYTTYDIDIKISKIPQVKTFLSNLANDIALTLFSQMNIEELNSLFSFRILGDFVPEPFALRSRFFERYQHEILNFISRDEFISNYDFFTVHKDNIIKYLCFDALNSKDSFNLNINDILYECSNSRDFKRIFNKLIDSKIDAKYKTSYKNYFKDITPQDIMDFDFNLSDDSYIIFKSYFFSHSFWLYSFKFKYHSYYVVDVGKNINKDLFNEFVIHGESFMVKYTFDEFSPEDVYKLNESDETKQSLIDVYNIIYYISRLSDDELSVFFKKLLISIVFES